ncbi:MAG: 6-phosphogluconolactonase [Chloroflexi bacterium]|nr:MAG: 6-phosphogluconolactonase [Chloroflexota bacterium]
MITIKIFTSPVELSRFAAEQFKEVTLAAVAQRGQFLAALAGGGTPQALYRLLAQSPYRETLPWDKMRFFWGDERCVPPENAESCYQQAYATWLAQVPVPPGNLHRAKGELDPALAAADYARQLKDMAEAGHSWPSFDFVLLGLGADGHTASLFPGSELTSGYATVAVTAHYQDRPANRVSMTPEVFNAARTVVFLASGPEKARALAITLTGRREPVKFPAQRIRPLNGDVWWLVDQSAASLLPDHIEGMTLQKQPDGLQ